MNKERCENYKNNLVKWFWVSALAALVCLFGFWFANLQIGAFLICIMFSIFAFISMWIHMYKHGKEFEENY